MTYKYPDAEKNKEYALPSEMDVQECSYSYKYDRNGNITEIQRVPHKGSTEKILKDTFQYDERNQLIRENSQSEDKTIVYAYDQGGNLKSVKNMRTLRNLTGNSGSRGNWYIQQHMERPAPELGWYCHDL